MVGSRSIARNGSRLAPPKIIPAQPLSGRTLNPCQNHYVPLFAAAPELGVTVAILVAVCMWPSQRLAKGSGNVELVEHARHDVIDDVVDRLRMIVEGRHRRHDRGAHARELEHVLQMHLGQRRLAHHQDQAPALLEHDVGGAVHEVLAVAVGDSASVRTEQGSPPCPRS